MKKALFLSCALALSVAFSAVSSPSSSAFLSEQAFTKAYVKEAKKHFKDAKFKVTGELTIEVTHSENMTQSTDLTNAYLRYSNEKASLKDIFSDHIASAKSINSLTDESKLQLSQLRPVIKPAAYIDNITAQINQSGDSDIPFPFYYEQLNDELVLLLAIDTPTSIQYVGQEKLAEFNLPVKQLKDIAKSNLESYLAKIGAKLQKIDQKDETSNIYMFIADEIYEASAVFSNYFEQQIKATFNGPVGLVFPNRSSVLVVPLDDEAGLYQIAMLAYSEYPNLSYNVSPFAYEYKDGVLKRIEF
ncbi:hypothetical protein N473_04610 [Pseudoalteromonas luteoviolacea CPMOR-1]|uniref:DUF1444 family protein n=1 Tax=Pseudoalteromonas luteoviolacea CPMOR-1 TaxID=1365248 RepID=A0A167HZU1_9GAMM|nr:DUF1444 family protein [Pseudoalteromonas luteoviolacea]KZN58721.1 hypothetical protein N473_04610 [Pseudoalteromonas luteoviolacea CPMOR-1]